MAPQPCTELDGQPLRDVFTVLAHSAAYTPDQFLHVLTFSGLHSWLLRLHSEPTYARPPAKPPPRSPPAACSALIGPLHGRRTRAAHRHPLLEGEFRETILRYCIRMLEQLETLQPWLDETVTLRKYGAPPRPAALS